MQIEILSNETGQKSFFSAPCDIPKEEQVKRINEVKRYYNSLKTNKRTKKYTVTNC